ncbi:MAG: hypothetical protein J0M25_07405 [Flavobacteriales bacterium]|nr:hypothetical protein [Flavobacteriales bacterium]
MKNKLVAFLWLAIASVSCSSDDDSSGTTAVNYYPLTSGNSWNYEVEGETVQTDVLTVGDDVTINGKTYKKMLTETTPTGMYCTFLNNNGLRKNDNKVLLSGAITFDLGLSAPFEFQLDDFVILKENATSNETLSTKTGTINQDFDGIPVTIDYTLKTVGVESLPTYTTTRGEVYTDVKKVKFTISLKVVAVVSIPGSPIPLNVTILNTQDVVTANQFYAKEIGMVYAENVISYNLAINPDDFDLPIPQSATQTQKEFLTTYIVN